MEPQRFTAAIVAGLKEKLGTGIAEIAVVEGEFSPTEIAATYQKQPVALVLRLDGGELDKSDLQARRYPLALEIFVVAAAATPAARMKLVLPVIAKTLAAVVGNVWKTDYADAPQSIRYENATTDDMIAKGLSVWMVSWIQRLSFEQVSIEKLTDLVAIDVDYHFAGDDEEEAPRAEDEILIGLTE